MSVSSVLPSVGRRAASWVVALVAVLGVLAPASTASAHAELISSFPGNQELLVDSPTEIALQFTESVDPIEPGIRVVDADGNDIELGPVSQAAGTERMRAAVPTTLGDGTYVVAWQAVSADSHRVRGSFTFSVGVPSAVTPGVLDGLFDGGSDSSAESLLLGIGRFLSFTGVGLLVGGLVMALTLAPSMVAHSRRMVLSLVVAAELAFVGTLWMVAAQANIIGGSFLAWGSVANTQAGQWWIARLVVIALFSVLIALRSRLAVRGGAVVAAVLGLGVLGVVAAGGHAISGDSVTLGFVSTLVHLAAMSIWFGGLAVLLLVPRDEFWPTTARFSPWALASVVALAISGSANAWRQLGSLSGISDSSYGRWLIIKLALVVLVVGAAAFSRRTLHTRADDASDILRRSVAFEVAGIVLILGATAGLVNSPPPVDTAEIVSVSAVVGSRVAQVELEPAVTGGTEMHIYITSPSGALDRADEITVTAELPAQDIPPFDVETFPAGVNHVIGANLNLPVAGLWTFEVTARYGEFDQVVFTVQIPVTD